METGELQERKLSHGDGQAERFYRELGEPALIGIEATGNSQWFLDLVQRLRTTESSAYTLRDTPTFTCIACSVERALGALDGAALSLTAP